LGIQLDHESITFSARAGLVFESILLSFALADQINILRNQKEEAIEKYESQRTLLELHSRQAQMGEMISAITHQWKQPLNLIMIMLKEIQMTSSKAGEKISQEIDAEISNMKSVILAMSSTMDDFKNFFSPSKKKIVFSPILTIQNILSMFGKEYSHAGITFEISGSQELRVLGKENELKQVLLNLFNNSKDAFYSHNIKNRKIVVKVEKENKFLLIYIKDNAGGISGDILGKIFEQHYTTKGDSGTGIGLYICKKIIEESFAGKITVKNIEGGVTFTIELPIAHQ
jgi:signal transduction histidine kinase